MADNGDRTTPRQRKFKPNKPSAARRSKPVQVKPEESVEAVGEDAIECPQHLLRRVNEHLTRVKGKADKKSTQVAFGPGPQVLRTFEKPRQVTDRNKSDSVSRDSAPGYGQNLLSSPYTGVTDDGVAEAIKTDFSGGLEKRKKYKEPWDYENSCYPITLPLRRPNSGDPEILDEAEFGKATTNLDHDENSLDAASELGLREKVDQQRMLFFQLPSDLPAFRSNAGMRGATNRPAGSGQKATGEHNLELSKGFMGKMLVYKSGAVKLKLGEIMYDVSPGSDCTFAQHVAAMNTTKKYFCDLGELDKRAVVTPDIDSLLESMDE